MLISVQWILLPINTSRANDSKKISKFVKCALHMRTILISAEIDSENDSHKGL